MKKDAKVRNVAIVHFNTPLLTTALVQSIRKHGGENYKIHIFDNSDEHPFPRKRMRGVKVWDNRQGQLLDFEKELEKYPEKDESIGCAKGCWFGSDKHMMSVQKLWELIPEGFVLMDSDVLIAKDIDWMFMEEQCCCGYISTSSGPWATPRLAPMLLWINVKMCVAGGARFFDPDRAWALHQGYDKRNYWDTGAAFLDDIKRLKPQSHGKAITRDKILEHIVHFGGGSWRKNDIGEQKAWLEMYRGLWESIDK